MSNEQRKGVLTVCWSTSFVRLGQKKENYHRSYWPSHHHHFTQSRCIREADDIFTCKQSSGNWAYSENHNTCLFTRSLVITMNCQNEPKCLCCYITVSYMWWTSVCLCNYYTTSEPGIWYLQEIYWKTVWHNWG